MTKTILRYFIIVALISLTLSSTLSTAIIYSDNLKNKETEMEYIVELIEYSLDYDEDLESQLDIVTPIAYTDNSRITIIDEDGNVLADSYKENLENHKDRKEFIDAMENGFGFSQRRSETTDESTLYVAYHHDNHIIRLSVPYNALRDYSNSMIPALTISIVISLIVAYLLSRKLAFNISKPILEIGEGIDNMSDDYRFDLKDYQYKEFNRIVDTIRNLSHRLRKSMREVDYEKTKVNEILKQMSEGFILLDDKNTIISINQKAKEIVGEMNDHDNILDYLTNPELIDILNTSATEQQIEIKSQSSIYACYVSRMSLGTSLLFIDITLSKEQEQMRSEFFSNVSHELKTPMTSIKGYSELLSGGFITDKQQQNEMVKKIDNEVNNMSNLINDILMLSHLENDEIKIEKVPIKMKEITLEVLESYEALITKAHITIHNDFEEVDYLAEPQQMYTLLSNLIGNAIKYNNENGDVWIAITPEENAIRMIIKDNGIGIAKEDQPRLFERFYRVDKGRSKQLGGTGLGLAIVKHIVSLYKGTIHLESELGEGTTITVVLPWPEQ